MKKITLSSKERDALNQYSSYLKKNDLDGFFEKIAYEYLDISVLNNITKFLMYNCGIDIVSNISVPYSWMFYEVDFGKELVIPAHWDYIAPNSFRLAKAQKIILSPGALNNGKVASGAFDLCEFNEWHEEHNSGNYEKELSDIYSSNVTVFVNRSNLVNNNKTAFDANKEFTDFFGGPAVKVQVCT